MHLTLRTETGSASILTAPSLLALRRGALAMPAPSVVSLASKPVAAAGLSVLAFLAFRNPNLTDPKKEKKVEERVSHLVRPAQTVAPTLLVLLLYCASFALSLRTGAAVAAWSPGEAAGAALCAAGAAARLWCYRTLGRLFTYDLAIRSKHTLVRTGPYALCRHPSYTALVTALAGYTMFFFSPGMNEAYRAALRLEAYPALHFLMFPLGSWGLVTGMAAFLLWRVPREEAMLAGEFGEEWKRYCRATPSRFLPVLL